MGDGVIDSDWFQPLYVVVFKLVFFSPGWNIYFKLNVPLLEHKGNRSEEQIQFIMKILASQGKTKQES